MGPYILVIVMAVSSRAIIVTENTNQDNNIRRNSLPQEPPLSSRQQEQMPVPAQHVQPPLPTHNQQQPPIQPERHHLKIQRQQQLAPVHQEEQPPLQPQRQQHVPIQRQQPVHPAIHHQEQPSPQPQRQQHVPTQRQQQVPPPVHQQQPPPIQLRQEEHQQKQPTPIQRQQQPLPVRQQEHYIQQQQLQQQQQQRLVGQQPSSQLQEQSISQLQTRPQQMPAQQRQKPNQEQHMQPQLTKQQEQRHVQQQYMQQKQEEKDQDTSESNGVAEIKGFKSVVVHKPAASGDKGGGLKVQDPPKGWPFSEVHMNFNSHLENDDNAGNIVTARPEDVEDNIRQSHINLNHRQQLHIHQQNELKKQQQFQLHQQHLHHQQIQANQQQLLQQQQSQIQPPPLQIQQQQQQQQQTLHPDQFQQNTLQHQQHVQVHPSSQQLPITQFRPQQQTPVQHQLPQHPIQTHSIPIHHPHAQIRPQQPIQEQNVRPNTYELNPSVINNIQQENVHFAAFRNPPSQANNQGHHSRESAENSNQPLKIMINEPNILAHNIHVAKSPRVIVQNKALPNTINKDSASSPTRQTIAGSGFANNSPNNINQQAQHNAIETNIPSKTVTQSKHNVAPANTGTNNQQFGIVTYNHNQGVEGDPNYVWRDIGQGMEISSNTPSAGQISPVKTDLLDSSKAQKSVKTSTPTGQNTVVGSLTPNYLTQVQGSQVRQIHSFDHAHALGTSAIFGYKDAMTPTQFYMQQPYTISQDNILSHAPIQNTFYHTSGQPIQTNLQDSGNDIPKNSVILALKKNPVLGGSSVLQTQYYLSSAQPTAVSGGTSQKVVLNSNKKTIPGSLVLGNGMHVGYATASIGNQGTVITPHNAVPHSTPVQALYIPLQGIQSPATGYSSGIQLSPGQHSNNQLPNPYTGGIHFSTANTAGLQLSTGHTVGVPLPTVNPQGVQLPTGHGQQSISGLFLSSPTAGYTFPYSGVPAYNGLTGSTGFPVYNGLSGSAGHPVLHGSILGVKPISSGGSGISSQVGAPSLIAGGNHGILPNSPQTTAVDPRQANNQQALKSAAHSSRDLFSNVFPYQPTQITHHQGPAMFPRNNLNQNTFGLKIQQKHPIPPPNIKSAVPMKSSTNLVVHTVPSPLGQLFGLPNIFNKGYSPYAPTGTQNSILTRNNLTSLKPVIPGLLPRYPLRRTKSPSS